MHHQDFTYRGLLVGWKRVQPPDGCVDALQRSRTLREAYDHLWDEVLRQHSTPRGHCQDLWTKEPTCALRGPFTEQAHHRRHNA